MKKTFVTLVLLLITLVSSAQSAFTVTVDDKDYSFPIGATITVSDKELWKPDTMYLTKIDTLEVFDHKPYTVLTFDKGHALNCNGDYIEWSSLIDSPEYGGPQLYGESGSGWYEDKGVYEWVDSLTNFHSKINSAYGSWAYWSGGAAVSNYFCDVDEGDYLKQLSLPTGFAPHSGSNFLVTYGCYDGNQFSTDSRPIFDFADGEPRQLRGLWVTNNSYFLHSVLLGNSFNTSANPDTFINVTFEGFDSEGNSTGVVSHPLVGNGKVLRDWEFVNLSSLGKILTLKINYTFSEDQVGAYGFNSPAYVAIDDIEIYE